MLLKEVEKSNKSKVIDYVIVGIIGVLLIVGVIVVIKKSKK